MRRLFAILLLALFNFSLIAPLVFADSDSNLPACCRRAGKHHCGMSQDASHQQPSGVNVNASNKCPLFHANGAAATHTYARLSACTEPSAASFFVRPAGSAQTQARSRISFSRSWQKRGPPAFLS